MNSQERISWPLCWVGLIEKNTLLYIHFTPFPYTFPSTDLFRCLLGLTLRSLGASWNSSSGFRDIKKLPRQGLEQPDQSCPSSEEEACCTRWPPEVPSNPYWPVNLMLQLLWHCWLIVEHPLKMCASCPVIKGKVNYYWQSSPVLRILFFSALCQSVQRQAEIRLKNWADVCNLTCRHLMPCN